MTYMKRWLEVKIRMQAAVAAANASAAEAAKIIRDTCGQKASVVASAEGRVFDPHFLRQLGSAARLEYGGYRMYFSCNGLYRDECGTGTRPVTEQHIPMSLSETEACVEWLESFGTGAFISAWEAEQR